MANFEGWVGDKGGGYNRAEKHWKEVVWAEATYLEWKYEQKLLHK